GRRDGGVPGVDAGDARERWSGDDRSRIERQAGVPVVIACTVAITDGRRRISTSGGRHAVHFVRTLVIRAAAAAVVLAIGPCAAFAQQRPLVTEDPETVGSGRILVEAGLDYGRDMFFPLSGLEGNLLAVPTLGVSI